jgi:putative ABC transport system permease protein
MIGDCGKSPITGKFLQDTLSTFIPIRALSGVMSTMYSSVEARERDIATLRAIGFDRWAAFVGVIIEASMIAAIGGVLGIFVMLIVLHGYGISIVNSDVSQTVISMKPDTWTVVQGFSMAIAIGVLGGILPALASARGDVAAAFGR